MFKIVSHEYIQGFLWNVVNLYHILHKLLFEYWTKLNSHQNISKHQFVLKVPHLLQDTDVKLYTTEWSECSENTYSSLYIFNADIKLSLQSMITKQWWNTCHILICAVAYYTLYIRTMLSLHVNNFIIIYIANIDNLYIFIFKPGPYKQPLL